MELSMIYKISPNPSLPKRGKEKVKMIHSITRRANILILLRKRDLITERELERLLDKLDHLCRQITNFQSTLV